MTLNDHTGVNQREPVLASNPPPVKRVARCHGRAGPNRRIAALAARPIASTASVTGDFEGFGGFEAGASTRAQRVKNPVISGADVLNRRSQPRTVEAGTPRRAAIGRWPIPVACWTRAEPITSILSRRRSRQPSWSSTWVVLQARQRARRGRTVFWLLNPRMMRRLACPQGRSTPPQQLPVSRPPIRSASTTEGSSLTMSIDASGITQEGPPRASVKKTEGVLARV